MSARTNPRTPSKSIANGSRIGTVLVLMIAGCAAKETGISKAAPRTVRLDLDPNRAYVTVEEIEPRVERPKRPADLAPLPERATEPIAASRRLVAEQRYTEAALELERALRYAPNHPRIHEALALLHWQAGNLERARTHAAAAASADPDSATAHYILARCQLTAGEKQNALTELRTALLCSDFGNDSEIAALCHFYLAETLAGEGYLTAALRQYEEFGKTTRSLSPSDKSELASLLATRRGSAAEAKSRVLERLGRMEDAAEVLRPLAAAAPEDVALQTRYAQLLGGAGRYEAAAQVARTIPSDDDAVLALLVEIHERAGNPERVIEDLQLRKTARPDAANVVIRLADALVRSNRAAEASAELRSFLSQHPDAVEVRRKLIDTLVEAGEWVEALKLCARSAGDDRAHVDACEGVMARLGGDSPAVAIILASASNESGDAVYQYFCGRVAAKSGRVEEARALFRAALTIDKSSIPARAALAELSLQSCDYSAALQLAQRTDPDTPENAQLERMLGRTYDRLDDKEKAELHYRAATQLDRTDTESMFALASLYRRTQRGLQAQRQLRVLLDADPDNERARELLALALFEDGKAEPAIQEYQQLQKSSKKPTTIARCRILLDSGLRQDMEARRKLLLDAMDEGGVDAETLMALGQSWEDADPAKALEYFVKAAELAPEDEEAALGVVRCHQRLLDFEGAAERLAGLLRCRPNQHAWRRAMFGFYGLLGRYDESLTEARRQESRTDLDEAQRNDYREAIVEMLRESGRGDESIAALQAWSKEDAKDGVWKIQLADEYFRQRRYAEAALVYESLYRDSPQGQAGTRERLLTAFREAGRPVRAEQYLLEWFSDDPDNDRLVAVLAHSLGESGRLDDALELIHTWMPQTPQREVFQDLLVGELAAAGRHDECAEFLEALGDELIAVMRSGRDGRPRTPEDGLSDERRSRRPNEPYSMDRLHDRFEDLQVRRILALSNAKQFRNAEELLDAAMEGEADPPQRMRMLYTKSTILRAEGRHEAADEAMEAILELRAGDETLNNDLAYNWIDRGIRLEEAEPRIRLAVGRFPRQAAYLDTYGWLLYKKGDFAGAEAWLSRANRIRGGDDPVIHDHLGDAYWRLGRRDKAMEHWKKAVELIRLRREGEFSSDDERRVRDKTPDKIENAKGGSEPAIAPVGPPVNGKPPT